MDGRMIVRWGDYRRLAPCSVSEFDVIYQEWLLGWDRRVPTATRLLQEQGYRKSDALELILLCRRRDHGDDFVCNP